MSFFAKLPIKSRLTLFTFLVLCITLLLFILYLPNRVEKILEQDLRGKALTLDGFINQPLAAALGSEDSEKIKEILDVIKSDKQVSLVLLLNGSLQQEDSNYLYIHNKTLADRLVKDKKLVLKGKSGFQKVDNLLVRVLVIKDDNNNLLGTLAVAYSLDSVEVGKLAVQKTVIITGLIIFLLGLLLSLVVGNSIAQPIKLFAQEVSNMNQGQILSDTLELTGGGEIKELEEAYNIISLRLQEISRLTGDLKEGELGADKIKPYLAEGIDLKNAFQKCVPSLPQDKIAQDLLAIRYYLLQFYFQTEAVAADRLEEPILNEKIPGEIGKGLDKTLTSLKRMAKNAEGLVTGKPVTSEDVGSGSIGSQLSRLAVARDEQLKIVKALAEGDIDKALILAAGSTNNSSDAMPNTLLKAVENVKTVNTQLHLLARGELDNKGLQTNLPGQYKQPVKDIKAVLRLLQAQVEIVSKEKMLDPILEKRVPGHLGDSFKKMTDNLKQVLNNVHLIARGDLQQYLVDEGIQGELSLALKDSMDSLKTLAVQAQMLTKGELSNPILKKQVPGEIGDFFEKMVQNLIFLVKDIKDMVAGVNQLAEDIRRSSELIAKGTSDQAIQIEGSSSAIMELSASIQEISKNAKSSTDIASHANEMAKEGGEAVSKTIEGMREIRNRVEETASKIKELGNSSKEIGKIVEVISAIADQTNLLALNAAIEAARAGEQGRGFAVVADQVGQLAERSSKSAKEIAVLIEKIQIDTDKSVKAMISGTEVVEQGVKLAETSGSSLSNIINVVKEISRAVNEISAATSQQAKTSDQVSSAIERISEVAKTTATSTDEAVEHVRNLITMSRATEEKMSRFKI